MLLPTKPHSWVVLLLPFTNELANLAKTAFGLPSWVYNPYPTHLPDIISKLALDSLSLYGVVLNLLKAAAANFNQRNLTVLGMVLLLFSFILPTFIIPQIAESSYRYKSLYIALLIALFALIDRVAVVITQTLEKRDLTLEDEQKMMYKETYFVVLTMICLITTMYALQQAGENKLIIAGTSALIVFGAGKFTIDTLLKIDNS